MLDLLQEVGLKATFAPSAVEGLQLIRKEKFDCVISDIRMPGLSGIEFCREVRKDRRFASLPMIASSASAYENDRETALAAGFNGFVPKPISETLASPVAPATKTTAKHVGAPLRVGETCLLHRPDAWHDLKVELRGAGNVLHKN